MKPATNAQDGIQQSVPDRISETPVQPVGVRSPRSAVAITVAAISGIVALVCFATTLAPTQPVRLSVTGFGRNQHCEFAVVRLTNSGPHSISYWGYETNSPWYSYQFQTEGHATNYCPFWCGTGVIQCRLHAQQDVEFEVPLIERREYQIAVAYTLPTLLDTLRAKAPPWIATRLPMPREHLVLTSPLKRESVE